MVRTVCPLVLLSAWRGSAEDTVVTKPATFDSPKSICFESYNYSLPQVGLRVVKLAGGVMQSHFCLFCFSSHNIQQKIWLRYAIAEKSSQGIMAAYYDPRILSRKKQNNNSNSPQLKTVTSNLVHPHPHCSNLTQPIPIGLNSLNSYLMHAAQLWYYGVHHNAYMCHSVQLHESVKSSYHMPHRTIYVTTPSNQKPDSPYPPQSPPHLHQCPKHDEQPLHMAIDAAQLAFWNSLDRRRRNLTIPVGDYQEEDTQLTRHTDAPCSSDIGIQQ